MSRSIVIIPTYNEIENIEMMIRRVMGYITPFEILVVDDNSPDGTRQVVKNLMKEFPNRLHLLERSGKEGLGRAYIAGFKWCLQYDYAYIFEMDADFSHNPDDLEKLLEACENGADVAIGSRYKTGINVVNWPMSRVLMSYYASWYVRFITGMRIRDTTAGFVCYRKKVLETIELDQIKFKGYAFQIEMKHTAWKCGFKIEEVSIIFTDRTLGQSKMTKGIFKEAIWGVMELFFKGMFRKYPRVN